MDKNKIRIILGVAVAFSLIIAIVLLCLGIFLDLQVLPKVILILTSVVALALTGEFGYFLYIALDTKPNYFLYNSQTKRNMPVQKLTFQVINGRMNRFLAGYAASEGKLWNDRVFDNPYLDMPDEFKPVVAYKLLYGLADKDAEAGWKCLENSSEGTINFICNGLMANGDEEFASQIQQIMERPVNIKLVRDYLVKNKKYIQVKMTKYVIDNIELF